MTSCSLSPISATYWRIVSGVGDYKRDSDVRNHQWTKAQRFLSALFRSVLQQSNTERLATWYNWTWSVCVDSLVFFLARSWQCSASCSPGAQEKDTPYSNKLQWHPQTSRGLGSPAKFHTNHKAATRVYL